MNVQIATQQPPTSAKVIFYTSHGQINLELWAKQTPLAARNFIEHCLSGYYLNTIFHRLIPGFMIQGGDPSGTGMGGQSIYEAPFKDEFHQRLKFSRRGILAMANSGKNTNRSQFFITFGPCEHLNKKHTIFGKVVGDTIYNLMALQSLDTREQDKPLDPPVIKKIKVLDHPLADIKANLIEGNQKQKLLTGRQENEQKAEETGQNNKKNKKQELKKLKNKKKLTFQNQEDQQNKISATKVVSSHQVLGNKDPGISNNSSITKEKLQMKRKQKQFSDQKSLSLKNNIILSKNLSLNQEEAPTNKLLESQMHKKRAMFDKNANQPQNGTLNDDTLNYIRRYNPTTDKYEIVFQDQLQKEREEIEKQLELERKTKQKQEISDDKLRQVRQMQLNEYNLLKADQLNFKKAKEGSLKQRRKEIIHQQKKLLSNLEKHRYEFAEKQKINLHQGQLFKKLINFTARLKSMRPSSNDQPQKNGSQQTQNQNPSNTTNNLKNSWMNHKLKFHIDSANAYSLEGKDSRKNKTIYQNDDGGLKIQIDDEEDGSNCNIDKLLQDI